MKKHAHILKNHFFWLPLITLIFSCNHPQQQLTPEQILGVKKDVTKLTSDIANDVSTKGPVAWLNYFENSPDFFMASEGQVVFHNYASAQSFIQDTLVKSISKINLQWGKMQVNVLTSKAVSIGSDFHEDITSLSSNQTVPVDGYFTSTAVLTNSGWKLRNLHWSVKTH